MKKIINKLLAARKNFYKWVNTQPCNTLTANGLI